MSEKKESVFENVENNENETTKRDILLTEIETEGKWQKRNKRKQTFFEEKKKRNDYKKGKTRRYTKRKNRKDE